MHCLQESVLLSCINASSDKRKDIDKECSMRIFMADDEPGKKRNHQSKDTILSETIKSYTLRLTALNYYDCPKAFESAF